MKKTVIINFILRIVGMGLSFIYIPNALKFLGIENYGIWATILSILSWINFFDIGIGNSLRTSLVKYIDEKKYLSIKKMISSAYVNISIISIIIIIVTTIFLKYINISNFLNIFTKDLEKIIFLSIFFVCINFVLSLCKPIYYAYQKPEVVSLIEIISQIINLIGILLFMYLKIENKIIYVCLLYGGSTLFSNLLFTYILLQNKKYLIPNIKFYDSKFNKELNNLGLKFFILQIACLILFTTDNIIITKLFGAQEVTPYNLVNKIFSVIISLYGILLTPLWSKVSKEKSVKNYKWIRDILKKLQLLSVIVFIGIVILYFCYPMISKMWLREDILYPKYLVLYVSIFAVLSIWCNNYSYIMNGMGEVNLQVSLAVLQSIINIPLSIYLGKNLNLGVSGVILATDLCMLIPAVIFPLKFKIREN